MCSSNLKLLSVSIPNSFSHLLSVTNAAPIFTYSVSPVLSKIRHLYSFPFIWLSGNQLNIKFADLASDLATYFITINVRCFVVYIVSYVCIID